MRARAPSARPGARARVGVQARAERLVGVAEVVRRELERLEQAAQVILLGRQRSGGRAQQRRRVPLAVDEEQDVPQGQRGLGPGDRIAEPRVDGLQVLDRGRPARVRLREPEREPHAVDPVGLRRLVQRAPEVGDGRLDRRRAHGRPPRRLQQLGDPRLAARGRHEQLRRDLLAGRAVVAQHAGRALVLQLALGGRELVVDGVAHERVHEAQRRLGAQDLRAHERPRRAGHGRLVELGERGDDGQLGALAQHAHRARHRRGVRGEPGEAEQDGAGDGARADGAHGVEVRGVGTDALGLQRAQQLAQQQRVAARGVVAGVAEGRLGGLAQLRAHERADRRRPERARAQRQRRRVVRDLGEQRGVRPGLAAAQRRGDEQRGAVEPAGEVGEEAQGGAVAPVQVVDGEQERALGGEVEREPVEAVQDGELGALLPVGLRSAGEHGRRGRRGAGEHGVGAGGHRRLEELAHDAPGELALELAGARGQHAQLVARAGAEVGQQAGLADPRGALDQGEPAAAAARLGDQVLQRGGLTVALEQAHARSASGSSRRERTPSLR